MASVARSHRVRSMIHCGVRNCCAQMAQWLRIERARTRKEARKGARKVSRKVVSVGEL